MLSSLNSMRHHPSRPREKRGVTDREKHFAFTLPELLITISIIAIIATFAFPSFHSLQTNQENKILRDTMISVIQFSENEAITLSKTIGMKLENNKLIVFTDDYLDGIIHDNKQKLFSQPLNLANGKLQIRSFPYYRNYLLFNGVYNDNASITYFVRNKLQWVLLLSQTGRIRYQLNQ